jgi:hypothetical protein
VSAAPVGINGFQRAIEAGFGLIVDDVSLVAISQVLIGHSVTSTGSVNPSAPV